MAEHLMAICQRREAEKVATIAFGTATVLRSRYSPHANCHMKVCNRGTWAHSATQASRQDSLGPNLPHAKN
eukprot:CAMPEP_0181538954 /NCGR_PEP_ID=MMETSP1110-20121109/76131_1 /TAXON_ID=174948 /ORGANISM="Symbiodinium sp., Strain CCMP421" /LENGTH=70 /DNA_ID=CAMNT_0023670569 /DNA_START=61 /DNA_END=273 /DNA_ORIENTATION=+